MIGQLDRIETRLRVCGQEMTQQECWAHLLSALQGSLPDATELGEEDWARICSLSQQLGVASLLYFRLLSQGCVKDLPAASHEYLRIAYTHTAMRNTRLYHFLKPVLIAMDESGIPVTLLKGAYLAKGVYRNIAARPMGDVDFLVPTDKLRLVAEIIEGMGYVPEHEVSPGRFGRCHHLPSYTSREGLSVEVHSSAHFMNLTGRISDDEYSRLSERARPWMMDGCEVSVLSPEDQLLHLCLHPSTAHAFVVDLRPFFDIAQMIEFHAGELDWDALLSRARSWGYLRAVVFTLSLVERWTGAALPPEVYELITPDMADPALISHVQRKVLNAPEEDFVAEFYERDSDDEFAVRCATVNIRPFFGRRGYTFNLSHFLRSAFPPAKTMRQEYPSACGSHMMLAISYPQRLGSLLKHGCVLLWRYLRREVVIRTTVKQETRLNRLIRRQDPRR